MSSDERPHRSYLFAPGDRPEVMRKALAAGADAVILDLEDAVAPAAKDGARTEVQRLLEEAADAAAEPASGAAIHVRINATPDGYDDRDLTIAVHPAVEAIRLPKAEDAAAIRAVSERIGVLESAAGMPVGTVRLYPTIESARGVMRAEQIATCDARIARLVAGRADLIADLGARGDDGLSLLVPQALIAIASRSAGIDAPVDGATTDLTDASVLRADLERARSLGYFGKSAIHPRQLDAIRSAFTPSAEEIEAATRIVRSAAAAGEGALSLDGQLVDAAIIRRAHGLLRLWREP
jgi:citrate lyase subunit beta / citryl-CoA lyase